MLTQLCRLSLQTSSTIISGCVRGNTDPVAWDYLACSRLYAIVYGIGITLEDCICVRKHQIQLTTIVQASCLRCNFRITDGPIFTIHERMPTLITKLIVRNSKWLIFFINYLFII